MTDRTDERIRALTVELAEQAPAAPTFQELAYRMPTEPRPRRRLQVMMVGGALAIASVAIVIGAVLVRSHEQTVRVRVGEPTTTAPTTSAPTADFPGFRPAAGWHVVTTPETFSAVAANVALGPSTLSGDAPWDTVERLEAGDVLLWAMFIAPSESWGDEALALFPPRSLPLSLDDALDGSGFEGQPDHIYADRLGSRVNGWAIDLLVFYGGGDPTAVPPVRAQPSAETRAAAQEQLARLVVPPR